MTVKELIARSKAAQAEFAFATQEQADAAAKAICKVVYDNAEKLGPMAAEESRMGSEQDKIAKCRNKSALIWESLKGKKSCDIINRIEERRMIEVAKPGRRRRLHHPLHQPRRHPHEQRRICTEVPQLRHLCTASPRCQVHQAAGRDVPRRAEEAGSARRSGAGSGRSLQ